MTITGLETTRFAGLLPGERTVPQPFRQAVAGFVEGPRVVAIGGGHGLAQGLTAIRSYAGKIAAVVSVADDGGSSGRLAPALDIPPPGDLRRCLAALAPVGSHWHGLLDFRFGDDDPGLAGHSLGNLILAGLNHMSDDFDAALQAAERLIGTVGQVIPASPHRLGLEAVVDGRAVAGQVAIARGHGTISELRVSPATATATPRAVDAIAGADQIVLGPGSLYTSVMAVLMVPGIVEAINASRARLVFILNLVTQDGETLGMDAVDHLEALHELTGIRLPHTMVANDAPVEIEPPRSRVTVDDEAVATYGVDVAFGDLVDRSVRWPQHHAGRLGRLLGRLVLT